MSRSPDQLAPWLIETEGGNHYIVWSKPYMVCKKKAISKWRKLTKKLFKKKVEVASATPLLCAAECHASCYTAAVDLLAYEELEGIDSSWWLDGFVEIKPGEQLVMATVCPMCEKHARRFRRSLRDRIIRIEERLDDFEFFQEEL